MSINRKFKRCFITGITGSGGSYLAEHVLSKDKNVKIYGTYRKNKIIKYFDKKKLSKLKLSKLDLLNFQKLKKYLKDTKPDLIYHLASDADVRKSFDFPLNVILNNNNITLNLLEAVRQNKLNPLIVICSTSEVYGNVFKKDMPITEAQLMSPQSPYAVSKCFQDLLAQVYFKCYKQKIIITRMFSYTNARRLNLFQTAFANQIALIEKKKQKYLKHGNLESIRTFIDIKDAMNAYWLTAKKGKIGEIYNIGGNSTRSVKQILDLLVSLSNSKINLKSSAKLFRPTDVKIQIPSSNKFKKQTKWKSEVSLSHSLKKLLEELRLR